MLTQSLFVTMHVHTATLSETLTREENIKEHWTKQRAGSGVAGRAGGLGPDPPEVGSTLTLYDMQCKN